MKKSVKFILLPLAGVVSTAILAFIVYIIASAIILIGGFLIIDTVSPNFAEAEIGEYYQKDFDGGSLKVHENYYVHINSFGDTRLIKLDMSNIDKEDFDDENFYQDDYETEILVGHYVYCSYTDEYAVLCEETKDRTLEFLSFEFDTETVEYYDDLEAVYQKFGNNLDWTDCSVTYDRLDKTASPEEYYAEYDRKDKEGL